MLIDTLCIDEGRNEAVPPRPRLRRRDPAQSEEQSDNRCEPSDLSHPHLLSTDAAATCGPRPPRRIPHLFPLYLPCDKRQCARRPMRKKSPGRRQFEAHCRVTAGFRSIGGSGIAEWYRNGYCRGNYALRNPFRPREILKSCKIVYAA